MRVNRLQKVLETANIKLASVATDVLGKSGRSMLDALLGGQEDPEILAELARGRLRAKLPDLRKALDGRVRPHHQVLLTRILAHIDFLEESLVELQKEMEQYLDPNARGDDVGAEHGGHQRDGGGQHHRRDWDGYDTLCIRQAYRVVGRSVSRKQTEWRQTTQWQDAASGNPYLRAILFEVAWAIAHTKDNYLSAFYHRMARRHGKPKAIAALAHKVFVIIYHILRTKKPYSDLGADYFDHQDRARLLVSIQISCEQVKCYATSFGTSVTV